MDEKSCIGFMARYVLTKSTEFLQSSASSLTRSHHHPSHPNPESTPWEKIAHRYHIPKFVFSKREKEILHALIILTFLIPIPYSKLNEGRRNLKGRIKYEEIRRFCFSFIYKIENCTVTEVVAGKRKD